MPLQTTVNKIDVATAFSRSATTYDTAADLQRQIGDKLFSYITSRDYQTVVDVGCGTGYSTQLLSNNLTVESLTGLDIAEGMVSYARQRNGAAKANFCCADAEQLPFRNLCVDLLFSNLALQWCPTLSSVLDEAYRVLMPGGRYIFSTLGPGTMFELQTAWKAVDKYVHVNYFAGSALIEQLAQKSGFKVQIHQQTVVRYYHHLNELISELKCLGANNINAGRPTGLTGRQRLQSFRQEYEKFRNNENLLPATYLVYFVLLEKDS